MLLPGGISGRSEWRSTGCAFVKGEKVSRLISVFTRFGSIRLERMLIWRLGGKGGLRMELKDNRNPAAVLGSS